MSIIEQFKKKLCPRCRKDFESLSEPLQRIYMKAYEEFGDRQAMMEAFGILFTLISYNLNVDYDEVHDFVDEIIDEIDSCRDRLEESEEENCEGDECGQ